MSFFSWRASWLVWRCQGQRFEINWKQFLPRNDAEGSGLGFVDFTGAECARRLACHFLRFFYQQQPQWELYEYRTIKNTCFNGLLKINTDFKCY
jgi:hypothetical protein